MEKKYVTVQNTYNLNYLPQILASISLDSESLKEISRKAGTGAHTFDWCARPNTKVRGWWLRSGHAARRTRRSAAWGVAWRGMAGSGVAWRGVALERGAACDPKRAVMRGEL